MAPTHIVIDSKLTAKDIRDSLWRCRDFELSHFWQRSILLLTMIALFATAYGNIVLELCKEVSKYCNECVNDIVYVYNNIAVVLCCVNIIFSVLWILMAKGSKAWYERYEAAIEAIENNDSFIADELRMKEEKKIGGFRYFNIEGYKEPNIDNNIVTTNGGGFSPSRINIFIGQLALLLWILASIFHLSIPYCMFEINDCLLKYVLSFIPIIVCIVILILIFNNEKCFKIKSSTKK